MTHLLDRIAAFIDGELGPEERERAMVHLAGCAQCRAEVAAQRAVKSRLAALANPEPSAALMAALTRLAEPGEPLPPPPARRRSAARDARPATVGVDRRPAAAGVDRRLATRTADGRPAAVGADGRPATVGADRRPATFGSGSSRQSVGGGWSRSRHRLRVLASTAIFGATATLVTAFAVGGPASEAPPLTPDTASYLVEHARTSRGVPFAELPAGAVDATFQSVSRR